MAVISIKSLISIVYSDFNIMLRLTGVTEGRVWGGEVMFASTAEWLEHS